MYEVLLKIIFHEIILFCSSITCIALGKKKSMFNKYQKQIICLCKCCFLLCI